MSALVRVTAALVLCAIITRWPQAAARYLDSSTFSASPDYGHGDIQLVGLTPSGESLIERRPSRRLPVGSYGFDDDYDNDGLQSDHSSQGTQVDIQYLTLHCGLPSRKNANLKCVGLILQATGM